MVHVCIYLQSIDIQLSYKLDALLRLFFFSVFTVTPPAVLPTIVLSFVETRCRLHLSKCIHGQPKIGRNTSRTMQLLQVCFCPKMASQAISEHFISKTFLGDHAPRPPQFCMLMHTYIHIRHPCNSPSENPGYGPQRENYFIFTDNQIPVSVRGLEFKLCL